MVWTRLELKIPVWEGGFDFKEDEDGEFLLNKLLSWLDLDVSLWITKQNTGKVENILEGSLVLIPSPSPSVKIQIIDWKVCLRYKGKKMLGIVNKLLKTKTTQSNVLPLQLKQTFPPIIWIFTEDWIQVTFLTGLRRVSVDDKVKYR